MFPVHTEPFWVIRFCVIRFTYVNFDEIGSLSCSPRFSGKSDQGAENHQNSYTITG